MRLGSPVGTVRRKATMTGANIPRLVKEVRGRLGLTEEQFAQRVGVTYGFVNHWENGKRRAPPFLVGRLVEMREEVVANTIPLKRNSAG